MCGINGFTFSDEQLVARMNAVTQHRGPDQTRSVVLPRISFGHNRLAIIDLSPRGSQPMWDAAKELVIVFNGEIYNYKELKKELQTDFQFQSDSDTEVILYAYKKYGAECLHKLNGIFAFAIWNERTAELFVARDRMGVNPFYYYEDNRGLIFSSEIKAIFEHGVPRSVDRQAFNLYFQLLYVPEPLTMFAGIKKLPAASYGVWRAGQQLEVKRYWSVTNFSNFENKSETVQSIKSTFTAAVNDQLVSDRPVGVFLSGGMDSTAVLGAAAGAVSGPIKTFSVGFTDSLNPEKFNADAMLAQKTAAYYGANHTELMIGPTDIKNNLEKIAWHLDEPNSNPTAGAMYLLAQEAKKQVAVVLGGDGGDELFGGYPRYFYSRLITLFQRSPRALQAVLVGAGGLIGGSRVRKALLTGPGAERITLFLGQKKSEWGQFLAAGIQEPGASERYIAERFFTDATFTGQADFAVDFEKYFMQVDRQSWLVDESLQRTNKMCLGFGLEPRVPVLDYQLVELSARIPSRWKFGIIGNSGRQFQGKQIWKQAIEGYLPAHVRDQQKRGWFTPMSKWMRGGLKDTVETMLSPSELSSEFFDPAGVQTLLTEHMESKAYHLPSLWALVMWQLWYRTFIKK